MKVDERDFRVETYRNSISNAPRHVKVIHGSTGRMIEVDDAKGGFESFAMKLLCDGIGGYRIDRLLLTKEDSGD